MVSPSASLLRKAVHQHSLTSRQGVLERMFTAFFDGLVYNQIWEDPRVDLEALELTSDSRVLTITSGGCNVLNYLVAQPRLIIGVDLNPYHMYLTRLKLTALEHLPDYESFFEFFGCANRLENISRYDSFMAPNLDVHAREYWEGRTVTGRRRIDAFGTQFYDHARNGYFLRFVAGLAHLLGKHPEKVLQAKTLAEQEQVFATEIAPFFDNVFVKGLAKLPFLVFGLGIPPRQLEALCEDAQGNIIELYRSRVKKLTCGFPIAENYFAWQAIARRYECDQRQAIPDYLKAEHYLVLKDNVSRIKTAIISVTEFLKYQPAQSLDRFVLLDAQEWMKSTEIEALWTEIARVGQPGARIIFRTAARKSTIEGVVSPELRKRFVYESERSHDWFHRDRSSIYGGFHLYRLAE